MYVIITDPIKSDMHATAKHAHNGACMTPLLLQVQTPGFGGLCRENCSVGCSFERTSAA